MARKHDAIEVIRDEDVQSVRWLCKGIVCRSYSDCDTCPAYMGSLGGWSIEKIQPTVCEIRSLMGVEKQNDQTYLKRRKNEKIRHHGT